MTNTIIGKDSLYETNAGVQLTNHTPSGSNAAGGPWYACTGYSPLVSLAGGGFVGNGSGTLVYLSGTSIANNNSVSCQLSFTVLSCASGIALWADSSGQSGYVFYWNGFANQWQLAQYSPGNGSPSLGTISYAAPVAFTTYVLNLTRTLANGINTLTASINGAVVLTVNDATHTGALYAGLHGYSATYSTFTNFECDNISGTGPNPPPPPQFTANIVCHGDSLTYGYDTDLPHGGPVANPYPTVLAAAVPGYSVIGRGAPGYTIAELQADFPNVQPYFIAGIPNIVVFEGFWNDCLQGSAGSQINTALQSYIATAQAGGWKVIVNSPTAAYYLSTGPIPAIQESVRQNYLGYLLAWQQASEANVITYEGFDPKYGNQAFCQQDSTLWCSDHLHFNQAGYTGLAPFAQVGVLQCLNP